MKFNWDGFTEVDFANYCAKVENNMFNNGEYCIGCVRVGDLCFDLLITRLNRKLVLFYDLYIGGINDGYGYGFHAYPYTEGGGRYFEDTMISLTYDKFIESAERAFVDYIFNSNYAEKYHLVEKANEPLHVW